MKKYKTLKGNGFELYISDNRKIIPKLNFRNSVIITSPPYNFGRNYDNYNDNMEYNKYLKELTKTFRILYKNIEDDTRIIVILKDNFLKRNFTNFDFYNIMAKIGYKMYGYFVVESSHVSRFNAFGSWLSASAPVIKTKHEMIHVYYKDKYKRENIGTTTITKDEFIDYTSSLIKGNGWFLKEINKKIHPAQFSPSLIDRIVKLFTFKEDTIIDIYCGVGNTGISALRNGRRFIGIDLSEEYIKIAFEKLSMAKIERNVI